MMGKGRCLSLFTKLKLSKSFGLHKANIVARIPSAAIPSAARQPQSQIHLILSSCYKNLFVFKVT